jgi:hypothetical protein
MGRANEENRRKGGEAPPTNLVGYDPTKLGEAEIIFLTTPSWRNRGGWLAKVGVVAERSK